MATEADILYPSATALDQTYGTDVRKLLETVPALNSTTICGHANAAGTTDLTLDPYSTNSTVGDTRTNLGWAINFAGADGMESTANYKRRVQAGNWVFTNRVGLPTAGAVTGTLTASFAATVYRVGPAPSFTRTLLFTTAQSSTVQSNGLGAATGTCSVTHAAPEIILQAGETLQVSYVSRVVQVAGAVGATVAGTATWHTGAQGGVNVSINPPPIDTITQIRGSASGSGNATAQVAKVLGVQGSAAGAGVADGRGAATMTMVGTAAGSGQAAGQLGAIKGVVGIAAGAGVATGQLASIKGFVGSVNIGGAGGGTTVVNVIRRPVYVLGD